MNREPNVGLVSISPARPTAQPAARPVDLLRLLRFVVALQPRLVRRHEVLDRPFVHRFADFVGDLPASCEEFTDVLDRSIYRFSNKDDRPDKSFPKT